MVARVSAIVFIYICTSLAWLVLAGTVSLRTGTQDHKLTSAVGQLWGSVQKQKAPLAYYQTTREVKTGKTEGAKTTIETKTETVSHYFPLDAGNVDVDLRLEHRRKGLLWYSTYRVKFAGKYRVVNPSDQPQRIFINFVFPTQGAVYDDFHFVVAGKEIQNIELSSGNLERAISLQPGKAEAFEISFVSQGMDEWWYDFGSDVTQVKNFSLTMHTNFDEIDFPQTSISPTEKRRTRDGWDVLWRYSNLLSGVKIGMLMPKKLNPGPWVSSITYAAPVSLFLFFFLLFLFTTIKRISLHPMNYFFIGAAFFSFHLLLAYLVDHISIHVAFLISSLVSIFLVVSYVRLVVGPRFAFVEVGLAQFVYLVLFSYTFFFEEYTGLAITILCIVTLFIVMQFTARVDWGKLSQHGPEPAGKAGQGV